MGWRSDDIEVVFIPDVEWDVELPAVETHAAIDFEAMRDESQEPSADECVRPGDKRAVQGCFCTKCSGYRSRKR